MKNNSENKHTPGEWVVNPYHSDIIGVGDANPITWQGVAHLYGDKAHAKANAAHIVKCVNSHDELVAALKMFVTDFEKTCPTLSASGLEVKYNLAKSALQKAGIESLQKSSS